MTTSRDYYGQAAAKIAQARAINDHFEGKAVPADAANSMQRFLEDAKDLRRQGEMREQEEFLAEPQYKHSMTGHGDKGWAPKADGTIEFDTGGRGGPAFGEFGAYIKAVAEGREGKSALVEDSTSGGQNLVPAHYAGTILKELPRRGVIRNLATVIPTTSNKVDLGNVTINTAGWGQLELSGSTTTDGLAGTPNAAKDTIQVHDLTALVLLGEDELEDAAGLEILVRDALTQKFAELEDDAFAFGDGSAKPTGIAYGSTITQLSTASAAQTLTGDAVTGLSFRVPAWAQADGVYLAHSSVTEAAMLLKDSNGAYIWQPSVAEGQPATWRGKPWYTLDGLPAMSASTGAIDTSLVFGSVKLGYAIADRKQITVKRLVERYAEQGKIGLLFKLRVGGGIQRPKALAAHKL